MFGSKLYTGIVLEDNVLKIARLKWEGGKLHLVNLDQVKLVEHLKVDSQKETNVFEEEHPGEQEEDDIFGLDDDMGEEDEDEEDLDLSDDLGEELSIDDLENLDEEEDTDDLDSMFEEQEGDDIDMVEEAEEEASNEMLLYNLLNDIDSKRVDLGINIPAGHTIFQTIRDTNFNEVKRKDLIEDLESKLESIYGAPKSEDYYSYEIRDDGSLILASIEDEPALLGLINRSLEFYSGKLVVQDVVPDEVALAGMARANYPLQNGEMTGIIQFGPQRCRLVFLNGEEIWLVSPIINEGTSGNNLLNTIFSKILFQLDTGEVPNLDRLILANNTLGEEAIEFFKNNFPDIDVDEFRYDEELINLEGMEQASVNSFTTAMATAWAASGSQSEDFPGLSIVPEYIVDRQKIFKLQWHGVLLLTLIFLIPVIFNHFYQQNARDIQSLESNISRINSQITQLEPTVENVNQLSGELTNLKDKLVLLDTLARGSREWSAKFNLINERMRQTRSSWFTSMTSSDEGYFFEGYSLYRNQIPAITNIFSNATLLNVSIAELREKEIYKFSILVKEFAADDSLYSPPTPDRVEQLLSR